MPTKVGFNPYGSRLEQNLYEKLVIESIAMYGMDMWYIPRQTNNIDPILNEDAISTYNQAYQCTFYVKNVEGFTGQGDFLSKFGLEIRDQAQLSVARNTFNKCVPNLIRPNEGDLIYIPFNGKIFVNRFTEHEELFYQFGKLTLWTINVELFEYSGERLETGIPAVDNIGKNFSVNYANFGILTEDGAIITDENGFGITQEFNLAGQNVIEQNDIFNNEAANGVINFSEENPFGDLLTA